MPGAGVDTPSPPPPACLALPSWVPMTVRDESRSVCLASCVITPITPITRSSSGNMCADKEKGELSARPECPVPVTALPALTREGSGVISVLTEASAGGSTQPCYSSSHPSPSPLRGRQGPTSAPLQAAAQPLSPPPLSVAGFFGAQRDSGGEVNPIFQLYHPAQTKGKECLAWCPLKS